MTSREPSMQNREPMKADNLTLAALGRTVEMAGGDGCSLIRAETWVTMHSLRRLAKAQRALRDVFHPHVKVEDIL